MLCYKKVIAEIVTDDVIDFCIIYGNVNFNYNYNDYKYFCHTST